MVTLARLRIDQYWSLRLPYLSIGGKDKNSRDCVDSTDLHKETRKKKTCPNLPPKAVERGGRG